MEALAAKKLLNIRRGLDDRENLIYVITQGLAPVIEGLKPGTILNFTRDNRNILGEWDRYEECFQRYYNISYCTLLEEENRKVVYFYDKELLKSRLNSNKAIEFLYGFGYNNSRDINSCINILKGKYLGGYPHEIGLFLGIPIDDVKAFIENNGKNYIFCGYWKVYNEPHRALNTFRAYDRAIENLLTDKFIN